MASSTAPVAAGYPGTGTRLSAEDVKGWSAAQIEEVLGRVSLELHYLTNEKHYLAQQLRQRQGSLAPPASDPSSPRPSAEGQEERDFSCFSRGEAVREEEEEKKENPEKRRKV